MGVADNTASSPPSPPETITVVVIEPAVPAHSPVRVQPEKAAQEVQQLTESSLDSLKQAAANTEELFNTGIRSAVRGISEVANVAQRGAEEGRSAASQLYEEGKSYVDVGIAHYRAAEDEVFSALKHGIEWGIVNPYISYPAAALGLLLTIPVTRKLIVRNTIGTFRTPEAVRDSADSSIATLRKLKEDHAADGKKLLERAANAEWEMTEGQRKLRAARSEIQRLASVVGQAESKANRVLRDLRTIKRLDKVSEMRAEAATQFAAFKAQRILLEKQAYRIASQDV